ncbi:MAG: A24 family peptidase [Planctomycetaceae bacterium]
MDNAWIFTGIDWSFFLRAPIPELARHPWWLTFLPLFVLGAGLGWAVEVWVQRLTPLPSEKRARARAIISLSNALLWGLFGTVIVQLGTLELDEVLPNRAWEAGRFAYHLVLISLLLAATVTDLRDYVIPDEIILPGVIIGVLGAVLSGDWQIMHFWVDWNLAMPGLSGPYIPQWEKLHPHWHGLAWSVMGALIGAGVTWLIRGIAKFVLRQEALGLGDVTLMAMIGSFLGWQPAVIIILLAPLLGLLVGGAVRIAFGKTYLPYGPYLCLSAYLTLTCWRWIWQAEILAEQPQAQPIVSIRRLFGDWLGLLILAGIAVGGMIVMLGVVRLLKQIPVQKSGR